MRRVWIGVAAFGTALAALAACWAGGAPPGNITPGQAAGAGRPLVLPVPKDGRARPLVAVLAENAGAETTDFIIPISVLRDAGVADVVSVATAPGSIRLMPALQVRADRVIEQFDAEHPAGADVVIVPAMHDPSNPRMLRWLRAQAEGGAFIVAICEGAWVAANAGLLDGQVATTHWYALTRIARAFPGTRWIRDRRYVVDDGRMTTTGVTASIPASLALVEAMAGRPAAAAAAWRLGVTGWGPAHAADAYALSLERVLTAAGNWLAFWRHETLALPIEDGVDEMALALTADAWSRTYRSHAIATQALGAVRSRRGLLIEAAPPRRGPALTLAAGGAPAAALDAALEAIARRYDRGTAGFVALQLEYPPSPVAAGGTERR